MITRLSIRIWADACVARRTDRATANSGQTLFMGAKATHHRLGRWWTILECSPKSKPRRRRWDRYGASGNAVRRSGFEKKHLAKLATDPQVTLRRVDKLVAELSVGCYEHAAQLLADLRIALAPTGAASIRSHRTGRRSQEKASPTHLLAQRP